MRRSTDRILTTHVGSLPRPASLLDLMKSGERGHGLDGAVTRAVDAAVRQQIAHGADVVTDGEQGKASFGYLTERLTGFEPRPGARAELWSAEVRAFREYHAEYCRRAMTGGSVVALEPLVCVGPATYRGHAAIARDIANLTAWNPSSTWCAGPPNGSVLIREGSVPEPGPVRRHPQPSPAYVVAQESSGSAPNGDPAPASRQPGTART
jgi:hypothetical protein